MAIELKGNKTSETPSTVLASISQVKQVLAEAREITDIIEIRDMAVAAVAWATARGADEAAQMAMDIKLRAERKAGEYLQETELSKGAATPRTDIVSARLPTLEQLGVSQKESSRWQRIASIPEEWFEEYLANAKERTQTALLRAVNQMKIKEARKRAPSHVDTPPFPEKKYRCIVIDPPWPMEKSERTERPNQGRFLDYPTLTLDEITALPIQNLADEDLGCQIYLWTTHRFLPDAINLLKTWGATYHCTFTWIKPTGMTPFSYQLNSEFAVFGYIGPFEMRQMGLPVAFNASSSRHSEKPDEFYEIVLKGSPAGDGERLDMYARRPRLGFEPWGVDIDEFEGGK